MRHQTPYAASAALLAGLLLAASGCRLDTADGTGDSSAGAAAVSDGVMDHCLVVATTEFRTDGGLSVIDADSYDAAIDVTAIHADAVVRVLDDRVFVVNRQGGDSLQELDPDRAYATLAQQSVGRGANPWSIIPVGDGTAWVPLYNEGALQRVDVTPDGSVQTHGTPASLPTAYDADGSVEPLDGFLFDGVLYVLIQGLGAYPRCTPDSRGYLLAFDPETLAPAPVFDGQPALQLAACNPTTWLRVEDRLFVGHTGDTRVTVSDPVDDGGIEVVDLASGTSSGLIVTEADLGDRDITHIAGDAALLAEGTLWVAVAGDDFRADVLPFDLDAATPGPSAWSSDQGGIFDLDVAFDRVWVVDRSTEAPGVVALDAATGELVAGPIDTGFPPFSLAVLERDGCDAVTR